MCLELNFDGSLALYVVRSCSLARLQGSKVSRTEDAQSFDRQFVSTLFIRDHIRDHDLPRAALSFLVMLEHDGADQHTERVVMGCNENDYLDS